MASFYNIINYMAANIQQFAVKVQSESKTWAAYTFRSWLVDQWIMSAKPGLQALSPCSQTQDQQDQSDSDRGQAG